MIDSELKAMFAAGLSGFGLGWGGSALARGNDRVIAFVLGVYLTAWSRMR